MKCNVEREKGLQLWINNKKKISNSKLLNDQKKKRTGKRINSKITLKIDPLYIYKDIYL